MYRHTIPVNIGSDGDLFGGMIKRRNAVEAGIILGIGILVFNFLSVVPLLPRIIGFCVVFLLPAVIALIGIGNQSAMEFLVTIHKYRKRKDIIPYQIQIENVEEAPEFLIDKMKWKKEQRAKKKLEKQKEKERLELFDNKELVKAASTDKKKAKQLAKLQKKEAKKEQQAAKKEAKNQKELEKKLKKKKGK